MYISQVRLFEVSEKARLLGIPSIWPGLDAISMASRLSLDYKCNKLLVRQEYPKQP